VCCVSRRSNREDFVELRSLFAPHFDAPHLAFFGCS
jgi:hypothetical protein